MNSSVAGNRARLQTFIPTAAVGVAFSLEVASDTGLQPSVAEIAYIVDRQFVAAVQVSCNVVGGWDFGPVERVFADDC